MATDPTDDFERELDEEHVDTGVNPAGRSEPAKPDRLPTFSPIDVGGGSATSQPAVIRPVNRADDRTDDGPTSGPAGTYGSGGADNASGEPVKRPRGRPFGWRKDKDQKADDKGTVKVLDGLEAILVSGHSMVAAMLNEPGWNLEPQEAAKVVAGIERVNAYYPTAVLSGKTLAWTQLAMALGEVYGTRIVGTMLTKKPAQQPRVLQMPTPPPQPKHAGAGGQQVNGALKPEPPAQGPTGVRPSQMDPNPPKGDSDY